MSRRGSTDHAADELQGAVGGVDPSIEDELPPWDAGGQKNCTAAASKGVVPKMLQPRDENNLKPFVNTNRDTRSHIPWGTPSGEADYDDGGQAELLREVERLRLENAQLNMIRGNQSPVRVKRPDTKELENLVAAFNPDDKMGPDSVTYIEMIESAAAMYTWDNLTKFHAACYQLKGPAFVWWRSTCTTIRTWERFKTEFLCTFPVATCPIAIHNIMAKKKKEINESIDQYYFDMLALGRRAGFHEATIAKYIIAGMKEVLQGKNVSISQTRTLGELREQLKWVESLAITGDIMQVRRPNPTVMAQPEARRCFKCGIMGHVRQNCPKTDRPRQIRAIEAKAKNIRKVFVNSRELDAFLDTGGAVSTVRQRDADGLNSQTQDCNMVLRGFGGREVKVNRKLQASLKIDSVTVPIELKIVPNWAQDTAVLIGRDVLDRDDVDLCKQNGVYTIKWSNRLSTPNHGGSGDQGRIMMIEAIDLDAQMYSVEVKEHYETIEVEDVHFEGSEVTENEFLGVMEMFRECFSKNMKELGEAKGVEMIITLKDSEPVYQKPVKFEYSREAEVKKIVRQLLEAKIIVESDSPYSSRVVLVPKKKQ